MNTPPNPVASKAPTSATPPPQRGRRIRRLAAAIMERGSPRLAMSSFVTVATLAGFLASVVLRKIGLVEMSPRYVVSVGCAYLAFLGSLSLFVLAYRFRTRRRMAGGGGGDPGPLLNQLPLDCVDSPGLPLGGARASTPSAQLAEAPIDAGQSSNAKGSGGGSLDLGSGDGLLLVVVVLILAAIGSAVYASILVVFQAPLLLAEVLVDGVLLAGLSRRFKNTSIEHWTIGAIQRTWKSALFVAIVFGVVGFALQSLVPEASTMSEAFFMALSRRGQAS